MSGLHRSRPGLNRRRIRAIVLFVVLAGLAIPAGGAAYAYWSGAASGSGTGGTGTITALSLSPGTPAATLYPGGQSNVVLTASNPNDSVQHANSLALNSAQGTGGFSVDAGHSGCSVASLSFTTQTNAGAGWNIPARVGVVNGSLSVTLANALAMSAAASSACQGATFTVFLVAG